MENGTNNYILIIAGVVAITVELLLGVATGFDLLLIGVILIVGGLLGIVMNSFTVGLVATIVIGLVYVFLGRKLIKEKIRVEPKAMNADALIGKMGVVTQKITPTQAGQVKVDGEIWRATAKDTIDDGEKVTIQSIEGVTLTVGK